MEYDIAIAGAGPAGSAAAVAYLNRNQNLKIVLIDKSSFPRDKACGDGLSPGVVEILQKLGIDYRQIPSAHPVTRAEVHGLGKTGFVSDLADTEFAVKQGLIVRRTDFDFHLHKAAEAKGANILSECRFLKYSEHGDGVEILLRDLNSGANMKISAKILVGADGASSRVRKHANLPTPSDKTTGIALRSYASISDEWQDRIVISYMDSLKPGYGWMFPLGDGTANIGCGLMVSDYKKRKPDLKAALGEYMRFLAGKGLRCGRPEKMSSHILPAGMMRKFVKGRAALIGDSAAMINPLSGEGILYGLHAADILAEITCEAVSENTNIEESMSAFEKIFKKRFGSHFRACMTANRIIRSRFGCDMVLGAAENDMDVRKTGIDLMFGKGKFPVSQMMKVARHGIKPALIRKN